MTIHIVRKHISAVNVINASIQTGIYKDILCHIVERNYPWCSQCDNGFTTSSDLKRHIETHSEDKSYQCSQCDKAFNRNSDLQRHIVLHSGEKPYQCSQCDNGFTTCSGLKIHTETHTGEKSYHCS